MVQGFIGRQSRHVSPISILVTSSSNVIFTIVTVLGSMTYSIHSHDLIQNPTHDKRRKTKNKPEIN